MTQSEDIQKLVRRQVRSPRSAALAGILFSLLMATSMILLPGSAIVDPSQVSAEWLEAGASTVSVVLLLVPFAGIAFLWFTGVMRDLLADREDKFFATVFLGSGIVLVVMMFVWGAAYGAIFGTYQMGAGVVASYDFLIYAAIFTNQIIANYLLRMAGVYMMSTASLWTRTQAVPRWLSIITLIVSLGFLLFAGALRWARFMFPAWVLLVSVYILILNYRYTQEIESNEEPTLDV